MQLLPACMLPLLAVSLAPPILAATRAPTKAASAPVFAYVVPDGSAGEACVGACLKALAGRVRTRPGVRKATVEADGLVLEIQPGVFRSELVLRGLEGMRVEMRVPYQSIELRFVPTASFPPVSRLDEGVLVVEVGEDLKRAVEDKINFKFPVRMKCVGRLSGPEQNDSVLMRYEAERRPPFSLVPFMAEADVDGDRRADLYLRLEGLPELVVFNRSTGLLVVPVTQVQSALDEIPRCDQSPIRFARGVAKARVRCSDSTPAHLGDAVERVLSNNASELLLWTPDGRFTTCEPFVEGSAPPPDPKAKKKKSK